MPISAGDRVGPYEILAAIGKGGMGEVWKARDPRVGRDVAIKISQAQFSDHFSREARAVPGEMLPSLQGRCLAALVRLQGCAILSSF